jgi:hypothetical protein
MSHFLSAVLKNGNLFYLTSLDIESNRGNELRQYTKCIDDLSGHGAIRWFYGIEGGKDIEYRNFADPEKIPEEITNKILSAYPFCRWFGIPPPRILNKDIYTECVKSTITLIKAYYEFYTPKTFSEYCQIMLKHQEDCWLKILSTEKRMKPWKDRGVSAPGSVAKQAGIRGTCQPDT